MQSRMTTTCSKNLVSIYGRRTELVSNLQVDPVFLGCVPRQIGLGQGGGFKRLSSGKTARSDPDSTGWSPTAEHPPQALLLFSTSNDSTHPGSLNSRLSLAAKKKILSSIPGGSKRNPNLVTSNCRFGYIAVTVCICDDSLGRSEVVTNG